MIEFRTGNIFDSTAEALVNTVNCVGIMGRGVALQFKNLYPQNFKAYASACARNEVQPGKMFVYPLHELTGPKWIINFPTKRHWRGKSRIEDIESGLAALKKEIAELGIKSIAIPPLGSGLGGLPWPEVRLRIENALKELPNVNVSVFEPHDVPKPMTKGNAPSMTPGRAALVVLVERYLNGLLDPFVTLLEIHKLMYFMQEAGQPLKLRYVKGPYGPYAENLRHVLRSIEGYFIAGYADGGDAPEKEISIVPGATDDAARLLAADHDTSKRFDRVGELVDGFETPYGLELLATIHWVATREKAATKEDVLRLTYSWNERKKRFTERQIDLAYDRLKATSWLN
jgi:O-acetyl-ADP-ribose deacetylase (regulator of RNase III)